MNDVNREYAEVLMELNINGIMDTAYSYGNERLTNERFTGWTGYYTYDPRGSVSGITDSEGMIWQSYRYDGYGNITFGKPEYNNVYAYNAESYNPNVDVQYLRARYYCPTTADFLTEDSYLGNIADPLTLNRYNYVKSSPLNYVDPSGYVPVETVVDILSIGWSLNDLVADPSLSNLGFLVWDIGAAVVPYIPGSYVKKGSTAVNKVVKIVTKADDSVDTLKAIDHLSDIARTGQKIDSKSDAAKALLENKDEIIMGYKDMKGLVKKLGVSLKKENLEVHHLIEKRFADVMGIADTDSMYSILMDKDMHKKITKEIRERIGYSIDIHKKGPKTYDATPQQVYQALKAVYTKYGMEQYLEIIMEQVPEHIKSQICFN